MDKPLSYQDFKSIYARVPRLSVDIVVHMDGGLVLVERALQSYHGQWHLPGGTVYLGEPLQQAVRRIAKEETGLTVKPGKLLGYIEYHSEKKERGFGYTIGLVFDCKLLDAKVKLNHENASLKSFAVLPDNMIIDQREFMTSIQRKAV